MKLQVSLLSVALAACTAAPLAAQSLTTWDSPVKVIATDGALTKSSGCDGCADSGAHSTTRISGDGYAEFAAPALTRLFAGLGADLTASTASSTIDYAFSLWPSGAWEIRELGTYRKEGTYAAGDRFRVAVESGVVVYRRNGTIVYTSQAPPAYPLALDVTLYAAGASLTQATVAAAAPPPDAPPPPYFDPRPPPPPPPPPPQPPTAPALTGIGPYLAVTDRQPYAKPALPSLGPAGTAIADPVFGTPIRRITDNLTRPGTVDRSYRTPSSPHQNAWSVNASYFYVMGSGGVGPIPYAFDPATGTARRIQPSVTGDGGFVLKFYIEPQFSYVDDSIIYGSYSGPGSTLRTIDQYDFSTGAYTRLLDLDPLAPGLSGTYIGGVASSGGPVERIEAFFGGTSQDRHRYVVVFDRANPQNRQMVDTLASTINGLPSPVTLNFKLHHAMIDRSGRYVMLYSTSADQAAPRYAAQEYLWDLQAGAITELGTAALPYGHDAFGYGVYVNKDCCTATTWDAGQWQFRSLGAPLATRDLIRTVLTPKEVYLSDHTTWNNARPDRLTPVISGLYRFGTNTTAWRAWDDEIVAVQTDAPAGTDSTVWRLAHHRTNVADDRDATRVAFWYQPHPNVSQDGRWILFTSNWEKTLGTDSAGEAGTGARQDVFLLALRPARTPVAISTTALPGVRATLPYSATLAATGGRGAFVWSAAGLPPGLALDTSTGTIAGAPSASGNVTVTISVADAADATNSASAALSIDVAPSPLTISTTTLPGVRATLGYSAVLAASGGTGSYTWAIASGALPSGLTLDSSTGALGGTATAAGTSGFVVRAIDAGDATNVADGALTIVISPSPVEVATSPLASGRATLAYTGELQASGGTGAFLWTIAAGTLPSGITLDASSGALTGTPSAAGSFTFTAATTDAGDVTNTASRSFTLAVGGSPVQVTTTALAAGRERVTYSTTLQSTGGSAPKTWTAVAGLPNGLMLNASTGAISGTPSAAGAYSLTVRATDSVDGTNSATVTLPLSIAAGVKVTSPRTLPDATAGVAYAYGVLAANVVGTPKWNLQGGALPPGITLDAATGLLSGVPTTKGTYSFNARVKDASTDDTLTLTVVVR